MAITTASTGLSTAQTIAALASANALADSGLTIAEIVTALQRANNKNNAPSGDYPTLRKLESNPVLEVADQTANSILWPYLVDMSADGGTGLALFWSTDHAGQHTESGTWLATAPGPDGPWTQHGMIFRDDVTGGEQHETPSVMWDEVNSRWLMYYQLKFVPGHINQLTMVATAPTIMDNGTPTSWTVIGIAATETYLFNAGDGHAGYFKPFRYNGGWYAYSLYGGASTRFAFWESRDNGITYFPHPDIIEHNQHLCTHLASFDPSDFLVKPNSGCVIEREGQLWLLAPAAPGSAGGEDTMLPAICAFRIAGDATTFGRAVELTPALQNWEDSEQGVDSIGSAVRWNGRLIAVYRQGGGDGGFGLMEVL